VLAVTENKRDDTKNSFYRELDCVSDQFPKHHLKILFGDFTAEAGREDILNQQLEINDNNGYSSKLCHIKKI
jgi:hypothetical protein